MKELYILVDKEICVACGSCQAWSPDVFSYDEKSCAYNRLDNNTGTKSIPKEIWNDVNHKQYAQIIKKLKEEKRIAYSHKKLTYLDTDYFLENLTETR